MLFGDGAVVCSGVTRRLIYIAGPFRAASSWQIEQNIRRAEEAALEIWRMGGVGVCPHAMTRFYQGELPDRVWLDGDLALLARCDAVLLVQGWECSEGARAEKAHAETLAIPVFPDLAALRAWLVVAA